MKINDREEELSVVFGLDSGEIIGVLLQDGWHDSDKFSVMPISISTKVVDTDPDDLNPDHNFMGFTFYSSTIDSNIAGPLSSIVALKYQ